MTEREHNIDPEAQQVKTTPTTPTATVVPKSEGELSSGATAGIATGIGVGNVCCGPMCYCMPSLASTIVGVILYFVWKDKKPKTAKTILIVTLITAGIALFSMGVLFMLGMAGAILDSTNY